MPRYDFWDVIYWIKLPLFHILHNQMSVSFFTVVVFQISKFATQIVTYIFLDVFNLKGIVCLNRAIALKNAATIWKFFHGTLIGDSWRMGSKTLFSLHLSALVRDFNWWVQDLGISMKTQTKKC